MDTSSEKYWIKDLNKLDGFERNQRELKPD